MNRLFILAALIFLLFIIGFATIRPAVVVLILPLLLYLLLGLIYSPGEVKIRVERSLSAERLKTGDEVLVSLDLTNLGSTLEEVYLEDQIPDGLEVTQGSSRRLVALPAGGSVKWTYSLKGRRGYYGLRKVQATAREHLGLAERVVDLANHDALAFFRATSRRSKGAREWNSLMFANINRAIRRAGSTGVQPPDMFRIFIPMSLNRNVLQMSVSYWMGASGRICSGIDPYSSIRSWPRLPWQILS
jgi:uncharacterized protein (DUF58 family)